MILSVFIPVPSVRCGDFLFEISVFLVIKFGSQSIAKLFVIISILYDKYGYLNTRPTAMMNSLFSVCAECHMMSRGITESVIAK